MTAPLFADSQDLLRQRRLERGLPAEPAAVPSARRLLVFGGSLGSGLLALVLATWALISLRDRMVTAEIARMSAVPGQLQQLEGQLRDGKGKLDQLTKANETLAQGLVAVASGSALLTQLALQTPQGVQIMEATVSGQGLSLKGWADEQASFTRVNALSLLLSYGPLFQPDSVRLIKLTRPNEGGPPGVTWNLSAALADLSPAQQLSVLRKLGADGKVRRLQVLNSMGLLP